MTRFAGSAVDFTPPTMSSYGGGSNYSSAAGVVDVNNAYGAQREKAPRFDELSSMAMQTQSAEKQAAINAEGDVTAAGIQSLGKAKAGQLQAQASIKAAEAQASASTMGSALGAVGKIGGALIGLSDETTKSDVKRIDSALEKLRNLKPVTFHYKEEFSTSPERMHHGFIAQEFQKVLPDATYFDESVGKMCIDTGDVIGLLVRANQELEARIGMLEAKQALATV